VTQHTACHIRIGENPKKMAGSERALLRLTPSRVAGNLPYSLDKDYALDFLGIGRFRLWFFNYPFTKSPTY
jgi:hypothetical protein